MWQKIFSRFCIFRTKFKNSRYNVLVMPFRIHLFQLGRTRMGSGSFVIQVIISPRNLLNFAMFLTQNTLLYKFHLHFMFYHVCSFRLPQTFWTLFFNTIYIKHYKGNTPYWQWQRLMQLLCCSRGRRGFSMASWSSFIYELADSQLWEWVIG